MHHQLGLRIFLSTTTVACKNLSLNSSVIHTERTAFIYQHEKMRVHFLVYLNTIFFAYRVEIVNILWRWGGIIPEILPGLQAYSYYIKHLWEPARCWRWNATYRHKCPMALATDGERPLYNCYAHYPHPSTHILLKCTHIHSLFYSHYLPSTRS